MGGPSARAVAINRLAGEARRVGYGAREFRALLVAWFQVHSRVPRNLERIEEEVLVE